MNARFTKLLGVGGIGKARLYITDVDATLGRSESRPVELSPAKDFCKLHIVFHYAAVLSAGRLDVRPIGYVGADADGAELIRDMAKAGMDVSGVAADDTLPTMTGVCLQYPDKETCNFTAVNSACNLVTPAYALAHAERIGLDGASVAAALPEVQAESRIAFLKFAKKKGAFCVLSVPESEAKIFKNAGAFAYCDLLSVNHEEALALTGRSGSHEAAAMDLYKILCAYNPQMTLLVTCGKSGAYSVIKNRLEFIPPLPARAVNTTGAGDAFLGGFLAGLAAGLPVQKGADDVFYGESALTNAAELGAVCAGMAVESADTITESVDLKSIRERVAAGGWETDARFQNAAGISA